METINGISEIFIALNLILLFIFLTLKIIQAGK